VDSNATAWTSFPGRFTLTSAFRFPASIVALLLMSACAAQAQVLRPAVFLPLRGSVVRVEAEGAHSRLELGSGVTVAPAIVVTNCHVTRNATRIRIAGGGNLWDVTGLYADGNHDLCFLRVPAWRGKPVALVEGDALQSGQAVAAIGFTGGIGMSLKFGNVRALHWLDGGRVIESDSAFTSGASGGGLFDATGTLIGLLTFRERGGPGSYYSLPVRWIRDRLPSDDQWTDVGPLPDAMPFWQRDFETQPYFMRAARLNAESRWIELIELTGQWSMTYPRDVEPMRIRGDALQKLDRREDAVGAYADAVRLAPDYASAWYGLALAYASVGNLVESRRAEAALAGVDRDLAARRDVIERARVLQ
jgi:serine protease Do